jgi:excisionase family DNA binding protein
MGDTVQHLTAADVAERLQIPVFSVYEIAKKPGGLPALRIGKRLRFRLADLEQWEAERVQGQAREPRNGE